jgi:hypothetical protein
MQHRITGLTNARLRARPSKVALRSRRRTQGLGLMLAALFAVGGTPSTPALASSHMDAPLITFDPAANTTDVYAFVSQRPGSTQKYLTVAFAVYPFEEPGIGPNIYGFDDRVLYDIFIALDNNIAQGRSSRAYRFKFSTNRKSETTILPYLGLVEPAPKGQFPANQNFRQTYTVELYKFKRVGFDKVRLGSGIVPPNNQGRVTPYYNIGNDGDKAAKPGVATETALDPYTKNAIFDLALGHRAFAGQRDDGFYADVQSPFDLEFSFGRDRNTPTKPFDSQGGFNVHTAVLEIPLSELGNAKIAGVYVTTTRITPGKGVPLIEQVGRQGNPLFNELFVAFADKDRYNRTRPTSDAAMFGKYADNPELAKALGTTPIIPGLLRSIFIPDLIKVDLTTPPARLAGSPGFHRLGVFGGDVLQSSAQDPFGNGGLIPGGWPNGRRFGDDIENIGLIALGAAGPLGKIDPDFNASRVSTNDITYNQVFPYAATPHNGRVHDHH